MAVEYDEDEQRGFEPITNPYGVSGRLVACAITERVHVAQQTSYNNNNNNNSKCSKCKVSRVFRPLGAESSHADNCCVAAQMGVSAAPGG